MSMWMFWKIFGDICLYFSVISAFPTLFDFDFLFLWPALLGAASVSCAVVLQNLGHRKLRFLALGLALASLVLADSTIEYLILALPIAYAGVILFREAFSLEYYAFREFFLRVLTVWAVFFGVIFVAHEFEVMAGPSRHYLRWSVPLGSGVCFAVSGILLLRQLRLGEDARARAMSARQSAAVALGGSALLLGITALERLFHDQATSLADMLGKLMRWLFSLPIALFGWFVGLFIGGDLTEFQEELNGTDPTETSVPGGWGHMVDVGQSQIAEEVPAQPSFPWWLVIGILVVMAVALVFLLRILRRHGSAAQSTQPIRAVAPAQRRRREPNRSNRGKVRRAYRDFLRHQRKQGVKLRPDQTSQDILDSIAPGTDLHAAQALRQIYLSARYDPAHDVTAEDLRAAQSAMRRTKEE